MSKLLLGLAALGLAASTVSASAQPQVDIQARIGTTQHRDPYWRQDNRFRNYYQTRRNYNRLPRCNRWEVAVQNPYRYNRYICIDRDHYRTYWHRDRFDPYRR